MTKQKFIKLIWCGAIAGAALCGLLVFCTQYVKLATAGRRYDAASIQLSAVPHRQTAVVFGAGVLPNGTPTEYLRNRVQTAADLYKAGRVDRLLVTGDNSSSHYDEPTVMRDYAITLGVPAAKIVVDYAGFSTYDSCYRADAIFDISSATLVTQGYHLPRAITTCRAFGIDTIGVAATRTGRDWTLSYVLREHISTAKALFQIVVKPQPTVL